MRFTTQAFTTQTFTTKTPHVEQKWANDFVLALRLRDVSGAAIGAALADVDAYCADSGESAREAFGDPTAYAQSLAFSAEGEIATVDRSDIGAPVLFGALSAAGMLATIWGDRAMRLGEELTITVGMLVLLAVLAAAFLALWLAFGRVVGGLVRRPVLTWLAFTGCVVVLVGVLLLFGGVLFAVPAGVSLITGIVLLAIGSLGQWLSARRGGVDPVRGPDEADGIGGDTRPPSPRRAAATAALLLPLATLAFVGMNRLFGL